MPNVDGAWNIEIATPMGVQRFALALTTSGASLTGTATNAQGEIPLTDGEVDGDTAKFSASITQPFPLKLTFTLTVEGDSISGESKAGPFPASKVTGARA